MKQNNKTIDSLTKNEIDAYNNAKELRKETSELKNNAGIYLGMSIVSIAGAVGGSVYQMYQLCNGQDDPKFVGGFIALGVISAVSTLVHGISKKWQGMAEEQLSTLQKKTNYKRAAAIMENKSAQYK